MATKAKATTAKATTAARATTAKVTTPAKATTAKAPQTMDRHRELAFERRMSDQEALMWNIEKDPWLNPNGAALTILDRPVDIERMRAKIAYGLSRIPRLRERVVPGLGRMSPPVWATDPEFDLDYHV